MTRRLIAITVAIALAAVGTAGILWYVVSVNERAQADLTDPVTVAVANKQISAGTTGAMIREQKLVDFKQMPKGVVPDDVMGVIGPEFDKLAVTAPVQKGYLVTAGMFGEQSQVTSGLPLPTGKMAVTVETGAPEMVAGYVRPGAFVSIFSTYKVVDVEGKTTEKSRTKVLLPRVQVLAVGGNNGGNGEGASATGGGGSGGGGGALLITVAVTQTEGERLILALNTGSLYLGLLTDSIDVKVGPGVENTDATTSTPLYR